jgi:ABC-type branched-subunit amino acid transport system substrate-binding protein
MKETTERRRPGAFPPPIGWIPILVAIGAILAASAVAIVPQYATHQIFGVSGNGGSSGDSSGSASTNGAAGHAIGGVGNGSGAGGGAAVASAGDCTHGKNAGSTDTGVTAHQIHIATTTVTTGVGSGFLGEAVSGMRAAIARVNQSGGICGRTIALDSLNDGWDAPTGAADIAKFIGAGNVFALVGEPDSQGLDAAVQAGSIDRAGIPVVGTDGMLASQYTDPWIWPVAASTVTNVHIAAQYAVQHGAKRVGIVFDDKYKFGKEGASAFKAEVRRLTGGTLGMGDTCQTGYCPIAPDATDFSTPVQGFNTACTAQGGHDKCDFVVMLLEPQPMETWMKDEQNCSCTWYGTLVGGEPLFDDNMAGTCAQQCANMMVWTGYRPDIQPFDGQTPVYTFAHDLASVCPSCDPHNEFTEGAYLGTELFIAAAQKVGSNLTRAELRRVLDSETFDLGLSQPLHYGNGLPHLANTQMAAFRDNAAGTFNGWGYLNTGFIADAHAGSDIQGR